MIFFALSSVRPCTHSIEKNQPQCTVRDGLTYKVKSKLFLCEVVIVLQKYWKRNWTNDCFNYKFAQSNLLPNSSKLNFNHANVFCLLFALNHRLLCNHVHCILRATGVRHARTVIDLNFSQLTLLTPDFLPQFHAPSLITNWLIKIIT